jgi:hypothetical protein
LVVWRIHGGRAACPSAEGTRHRLLDMLIIAICAVICGADGWEDVESFGESKKDWLKGFLELPHGIPSQRHILAEDTFGRVFARLAPAQFEACFRAWIAAVSPRVRWWRWTVRRCAAPTTPPTTRRLSTRQYPAEW